MKIGLSRWRQHARIEDAGPYRWRRLFAHKGAALIWVRWASVDERCAGCGDLRDNGKAHGYGAEYGGCV
jgi:hypothetical protein